MVIETEPSPTATAGVAFNPQPVIFVEDQFGNLETGDNTTQVTAALSVGTGPLLGTTNETVSGGIAAFLNLFVDTAGTINLMFTAPALASAQSSPIAVSSAAATKLVLTAPATATANRPFTVIVTAFDRCSSA